MEGIRLAAQVAAHSTVAWQVEGQSQVLTFREEALENKSIYMCSIRKGGWFIIRMPGGAPGKAENSGGLPNGVCAKTLSVPVGIDEAVRSHEQVCQGGDLPWYGLYILC